MMEGTPTLIYSSQVCVSPLIADVERIKKISTKNNTDSEAGNDLSSHCKEISICMTMT